MTNPLIHLRKQWKLAALLGACTLMPALTARQQAHADAPADPPAAAPQDETNQGDETGRPQAGPRGRRPGAELRNRAIRRRPHRFDFNGAPDNPGDENGPYKQGIPEWRQRPNFGGRNRAPQGFGDQDETGPGRRGPGGQRFEGRGPGRDGDDQNGPRFEGRGQERDDNQGGPRFGGRDGQDGDQDNGPRFGGRRGPRGFGDGQDGPRFGGRRGPNGFGQDDDQNGGPRFGGRGGRFGGPPEGFGDGPQDGDQFQEGRGGRGPRGARGFGREGQAPFAGGGPRWRQAPEGGERGENAIGALQEAPAVSSAPKTLTGTISGVRGNSFSLRSGDGTLRVTLNGKLPAGLTDGNQVQLYGIQTGNTFQATNVRVLPRH